MFSAFLSMAARAHSKALRLSSFSGIAAGDALGVVLEGPEVFLRRVMWWNIHYILLKQSSFPWIESVGQNVGFHVRMQGGISSPPGHPRIANLRRGDLRG